MQTSLPQGIMKKTAISAPEKTNPNKPNFTPKCLQQRVKNYLPKISCLMAQDFLCCAHGLFMLWIKKEFFGENNK